jgi:hypothetical protein
MLAEMSAKMNANHKELKTGPCGGDDPLQNEKEKLHTEEEPVM